MIDFAIQGKLPTLVFNLDEKLPRVGEYMVKSIRQRIESTRRTKIQPPTHRLAASVHYTIQPDGVTIIAGGPEAPYAWIRHHGGFVKASPVTVIRRFNPSGTTAREQMGARFPRPFQTFQMARYFWAMWYQSKNPFYKATALKVHRLGGIQIQPNPFHFFSDENKVHILDILKVETTGVRFED